VSLWLNSWVPATEVARRAGHGVAVLLKIYAHCIDGQATAANAGAAVRGSRRAGRATARKGASEAAAPQGREPGGPAALVCKLSSC
jgi:hypothetical protein